MAGFFKRHPSLSLRTSQTTIPSRASSFNEHNISKFSYNIAGIMDRFKFEPKDIWNMNETGVTTVQQPNKIVARRSIKQVGAVTSAECGRLVTVANAVNAQGERIPPFFCFVFVVNIPYAVGCGGIGNAIEWIKDAEFLLFL